MDGDETILAGTAAFDRLIQYNITQHRLHQTQSKNNNPPYCFPIAMHEFLNLVPFLERQPIDACEPYPVPYDTGLAMQMLQWETTTP